MAPSHSTTPAGLPPDAPSEKAAMRCTCISGSLVDQAKRPTVFDFIAGLAATMSESADDPLPAPSLLADAGRRRQGHISRAVSLAGKKVRGQCRGARGRPLSLIGPETVSHDRLVSGNPSGGQSCAHLPALSQRRIHLRLRDREHLDLVSFDLRSTAFSRVCREHQAQLFQRRHRWAFDSRDEGCVPDGCARRSGKSETRGRQT